MAASDKRLSYLAALGAITAIAATWALIDYRQWSSIPGSGFSGWKAWVMSHQLKFTGRDPLDTAFLHEHPETKSYLGQIPSRHGPRPPMISWILPHRHVAQTRTDAKMTTELEAHLRSQGQRNSLLLAPSIREGNNGLACYSLRPSSSPAFQHDRLHIHTDNSIHVCLHPKDAALVVDQGWGVTFPLAGRPSPSGGLLDFGLVLLYAPRDADECNVVKQIMDAGIKYNLDCISDSAIGYI